MAADTVDDLLAGRPAHFSWRAARRAASGRAARAAPLHPGPAGARFQRAVEPGRAASEAIQAAARRLNLAGDYQARVRLTGLVPMNDAQFATLQEHARRSTAVISLVAVLLILWLALRSWRIIVAALIGLICGLADLRGARPVAGRHAEPDFGRVLCAVRRARRRFRPAIRGPLPRRAPRYRRAASGAA